MLRRFELQAMKKTGPQPQNYISLALRFGRRSYGQTSPNPLVGAVLMKGGKCSLAKAHARRKILL
jgi:pyrimidine deaminase RibD-like protein